LIAGKHLRRWYTDIRDWNTKLLKQFSGDPTHIFTEREQWVMAKMDFLKKQVRHRRAPVKSVSIN
jgi:hypothetical protein